MIIDAHSHIRVDNDFEKNFQKYMENLKLCNISKAIVSIDPFVAEFKCTKDYYHFVSINDNYSNLRTYCHTCKKETLYDYDPFEKYNEKLLSTNNDYLLPFLMLPVVNNKIKEEIEKYKKNICGLKIYTGLSEKVLDDLSEFNYDLPLLIHTGIQHNQNPKYMIDFLKKYKGYIILAHFARFCPEVIDIIKNSSNIFVDTSPAVYLFNNYISVQRKGGLFEKDGINLPSSLYYKAIEKFGIDKMIFGTDYPFSNRQSEIEILQNLKISATEYEKLASGNIRKILGGRI